MKKLIALILSLAFVCVLLCSCGKTPDPFAEMTMADLLHTIVDKANELDDKNNDPLSSVYYGMSTIEVHDNPIDTDNCEMVLGLTEEEFGTYVEEAIESQPDGSWYTHSVVVIRLKEDVDTAEVAEKIIMNTKPNRFGCLKPTCISGSYAGRYVVFCANNENACKAVADAFAELYTAETPTLIERENTWSSGGMMGGLLG